MTKIQFAIIAIALSSTSITSTAVAAPSGFLNVTNCSGGGVRVTATTIDWQNPAGGTNGCIATNTGTNVSYTGGGPLLSGNTSGLIKDLPPNPPVTDFMVWTNQPNLHFDLSILGPGSLNTACTAAFDPTAPACSVTSTSPFLLRSTPTGTAISLSASGTARDSSTGTSTWMGDFTTQFPGVTPKQIQDAILGGVTIPGLCAGGACTNSYSGSFLVKINGGTACPATVGFWKNARKHPFPPTVLSAGGLTIADQFYTICDLYRIMNNNGGNAVAILGRQLVAALLNVAAGATDNAAADAALADAQSKLKSNNLSLLTSDVNPSSTLGQQLIADASVLDNFNNANFGACSEGSNLQLGASSPSCP